MCCTPCRKRIVHTDTDRMHAYHFECVCSAAIGIRRRSVYPRHRYRPSRRRQWTEWGSFGGMHDFKNTYTRIALQFTCTQRIGRYVYIWVVISSRFISDRVSLSFSFCFVRFSTIFRHMHDCDEIPITRPPCGRPKFRRSWNKNNTRQSVKIEPTTKETQYWYLIQFHSSSNRVNKTNVLQGTLSSDMNIFSSNYQSKKNNSS